MNTVDFSTFKFHASGVKNLMVKSRSKTDSLSETTKTYLQEVWIEAVYGRRKPIITPAMQKGTIVESDSLSLVQQVSGVTYFKNQKEIANDFVIGTPDVIDQPGQAIRDVKSSWDIWTFAKVTAESARSDYYWQIASYCWMSNLRKGSLIYALVNTPEMLITDELYRLSFKMPEDQCDKLRINYEYDDIDPKSRVKQFDFDVLDTDIELIKNQVILAREYLKGMHL